MRPDDLVQSSYSAGAVEGAGAPPPPAFGLGAAVWFGGSVDPAGCSRSSISDEAGTVPAGVRPSSEPHDAAPRPAAIASVPTSASVTGADDARRGDGDVMRIDARSTVIVCVGSASSGCLRSRGSRPHATSRWHRAQAALASNPRVGSVRPVVGSLTSPHRSCVSDESAPAGYRHGYGADSDAEPSMLGYEAGVTGLGYAPGSLRPVVSAAERGEYVSRRLDIGPVLL